jgi:ferrous iron transport protein B
MALCCDTPDKPTASHGVLTVALAGNPNSGKTTLFNALTGLRQKVANYPGVTVEKKTGRCKLPDGSWANIIDLPGTYSLISRSPDEVVAMEVLRGLRTDVPAPDVVIVVVDASNLQRNLYLVSQLIELGRPLVVALNMMDVAQRRGQPVSPENLSATLGCPVVPIVGHKRKGIAELKEAIRRAAVAPLPDFALPDAMKEELMLLGGGLAIIDSEDQPTTAEKPKLGDAVPPRAWICRPDSNRRLDRYQAIAERLLIGDRAPDIEPVAHREPVAKLLTSATDRLSRLGIDPMQADVEAHYAWIESVVDRASGSRAIGTGGSPVSSSALVQLEYHGRAAHATTLTERVDAILIHKVWGLLVFTAIMALLFVSIFWLAQPLMDGIQNAVNWLADKVTTPLGDGPLHDLLKDGIFAGVGTVIVFVPQIALLFFFLAILEDSGYLARAAFLMDRLLAKVGLHGKSFIPLLSSFACAIPGIMSARTIESRKDRLATIFVAPFMSCSARLPVYTLLIGTVFASFGPVKQAGVMLVCYAGGIIAAVGTAWIFKRSLLKGGATSFILELPSYKMPQPFEVGRQVWKNSAQFLTKAGTTILAISILLWAVSYYPRMPSARVTGLNANWRLSTEALHYAFTQPPSSWRGAGAPSNAYFAADNQPGSFGMSDDHQHYSLDDGREIVFSPSEARMLNGRLTPEEIARVSEFREKEVANAVAAAQSEYSFAGRFGHAIEPVIRPLGFDWKMGVGLVSAFAARETFVSSMGITYAVGDTDSAGTADLESAMKHDHYANGKPVWTPLVAVSLLAWFVLAMQCMSTIAIVRRETAGWKWPIFMLVYMNALAYAVSLAIYQIGRLFV